MSYKVQFVDDETFNSLPGHNMEEKVGVAYPNEGIAYARRTGIGVLDAFTALHELEHLEGEDHDEHYDSENQCYYKGFGDVIKTIAPIALSFALPALAPALGGAFSTLGSGIQGIAGNFGLGNIFGSVGSALGGATRAIATPLGLAGKGAAPSTASTTNSLTGSLTSKIGGNPLASSPSTIFAGSKAPGIGAAIGSGVSSLAKTGAKAAGGQLTQNAAGSLFGGGSPLDGFQSPSLGSDTPSISAPSGPNVIPGASGEGSQGGPGGSPGSIGGGSVSKIKQYLANRDDSGGDLGIGGGNY
jgi:hypothetical protein